MIRPSDKANQETKQIMLSKKEMNPDFKPQRYKKRIHRER